MAKRHHIPRTSYGNLLAIFGSRQERDLSSKEPEVLSAARIPYLGKAISLRGQPTLLSLQWSLLDCHFRENDPGFDEPLSSILL